MEIMLKIGFVLIVFIGGAWWGRFYERQSTEEIDALRAEMIVEQDELIKICSEIVYELENPKSQGLWTKKYKEYTQ